MTTMSTASIVIIVNNKLKITRISERFYRYETRVTVNKSVVPIKPTFNRRSEVFVGIILIFYNLMLLHCVRLRRVDSILIVGTYSVLNRTGTRSD